MLLHYDTRASIGAELVPLPDLLADQPD